MRRPSPALVISIIALVFAMGGTGWAVTQLPRNSVGTKQIKKSAVTSAKVKDGTLVAADFKAGVLAGATGPKGETGPTGATGAQGIPGPTASAYAADPAPSTINLAPADGFTEVLRLTTAPTTSGALVLDEPMRVFLLADITAYKGSGLAAQVGHLTCRARYAPVGGSFTALAATPSATLPDVSAGTAVWTTLPINVPVDLAAGRYDVSVQCLATNSVGLGSASLVVSEVYLSVVAARI